MSVPDSLLLMTRWAFLPVMIALIFMPPVHTRLTDCRTIDVFQILALCLLLVSASVCSGMNFLNNGKLDSVPNLKKLKATKLGLFHSSKFPILLFEQGLKGPSLLSITDQFYCSSREPLRTVQITQGKNVPIKDFLHRQAAAG